MKIFKIIVDILLLITTFLLESMDITGRFYHEVLGIVITILIILHLLTNRKWIINITKNITKVNKRTRIMYLIDVLTMVMYFATITVGVLISEEIFKLGLGGYKLVLTHIILGRLTVIMMFIHLGLHLKMIFSHVKNIKVIYIIYAIIAICLSLYSIYKMTHSFQWVSVFR